MLDTLHDKSRRRKADHGDLVQAYLTEIGGLPLLGREQEVEIGRRIAEGEARILCQLLRLDSPVEEVLAMRRKVLEGELDLTDVVKGSEIHQERGNGSNSIEEAMMETWERAERLWRDVPPGCRDRARRLLGSLPINLRLLEPYHEALKTTLALAPGPQAPAYARMVGETGLSVRELKSIRAAVACAEEHISRAKADMVLGNLRLVVNVAMRYVNRGVPLLDLIQEGNLGLIKAVDRFDYARGYRFSSYATWWIRQGILRGAAEQLGAFRIPAHIMESFGKVLGASVRMRGELGRNPTSEELGRRVKMPTVTVSRMMLMTREPLSIDGPAGGCEEAKLLDIMEDEKTPEPTTVLGARQLKQYTRRLLSSLSPREEKILRKRFGIGADAEGTLEEIGEYFAISGERVRQILDKAIGRLRSPLQHVQARTHLK